MSEIKTNLSEFISEAFGSNATYVEGLLERYKTDPKLVDESWQTYFAELLAGGAPSTNGQTASSPQPATAATTTAKQPVAVQLTDDTAPKTITGPAKKIVENMEMSLTVPTATSVRNVPVKVLEDRDLADFPAGAAMLLYGLFFLMYLMPKLAGFIDILVSRGGAQRYGGATRFLAGAATELVFSFLQGAVSTFRTTLFMIGLAFGKSNISWGGQARDAHGISLRIAFEGLWPQLLFGIYVCGALLILSPKILIWSLPLTLGYLIAIPFAMITASPALGRALESARLCAIPEEFVTPDEVRAVQPAALAQQAAE